MLKKLTLLLGLLVISFSTSAIAIKCPSISDVNATSFNNPVKKESRYLVTGNILYNSIYYLGVVRIPSANSELDAVNKAKLFISKQTLHEPQKRVISGKEACLYFGNPSDKKEITVIAFNY
jgi:hypothetical protein